jgi:arylamine N-acetyltransferase
MGKMKIKNSLIDTYLRILGLMKSDPNLDYLTQIIRSHLCKIPFENISKLYRLKKYSLMTVPDFELYLEGISRYHFGGTCYANNYYINQLLNNLGYDVRLCGADMNNPDVHVVNIVSIDGRDYLVDVGYASPFLNPMPLDQSDEYEIIYGTDKYVLYPRNNRGCSVLKMFRKKEAKHGYIVKPDARSIAEFNDVIKDSFREEATFLNSLLLVRFESSLSVRIHNFSITKSMDGIFKQRDLKNMDELIMTIAFEFSIPQHIVSESVKMIRDFGDAWN